MQSDPRASGRFSVEHRGSTKCVAMRGLCAVADFVSQRQSVYACGLISLVVFQEVLYILPLCLTGEEKILLQGEIFERDLHEISCLQVRFCCHVRQDGNAETFLCGRKDCLPAAGFPDWFAGETFFCKSFVKDCTGPGAFLAQ